MLSLITAICAIIFFLATGILLMISCDVSNKRTERLLVGISECCHAACYLCLAISYYDLGNFNMSIFVIILGIVITIFLHIFVKLL